MKVKPVRRLLFVTGAFPATTPASVIFRVASARECGWKVHVLASEPGTNVGWALANDLGITAADVTVFAWRDFLPFPMPFHSWTSRFSRAADQESYGQVSSLRRRSFFAKLSQIPQIREANLIHAQWTEWADEVGIGLSKLLHIPLTMTARDSFLQNVATERLQNLQEHCAAIAVPSKWSRDVWQQKSGSAEKLHVIYNGIDLRVFPNGVPKPVNRVPKVITVGRLHPQKRHADVLRAAGLLAREGVDLECLVVGDGRERGELELLAKELGLFFKTTFTGEVPFKEGANLFRSSDIFALASEAESFGLVTAEAMAASLPVVVAKAGASPELVDEGESGFVFPVGDIQELANCIRKLAASSEMRIEFGRRGRAKVERQFSLEENASRMDALWSNALEDRESLQAAR